MISDKRICQLSLPMMILFDLAREQEDKCSRAITRYVSKTMFWLCDNDAKRAHKLTIRMAKVIKEMQYFVADKELLLSGRKMVFVSVFLTQLIFQEFEGKISEKALELAAKTKRLMEFAVWFEEKSRAKDERGDAEFEAIQNSAEKQATKVYEKFYKTMI